jgi:dipeptidyl aminopeptidase/acylaminoacyl peptidase
MRIIIFLLLPSFAIAQGTQADYERANDLAKNYANKVFRDTVTPNWFDEGTKFWYRVDLPLSKKEFVVVDCVKGTREIVSEDKLPKPVPPVPNSQPPSDPRPRGGKSPDGKWTAVIEKSNVVLRDAATKMETKLTTDGTPENAYGKLMWAPDSNHLIAIRTKAGGNRTVTLVESSPKDQLQPKTSSYFYLKPGDEVPQDEPHVFDITKKQKVTPIPPTGKIPFDNSWSLSDWHVANATEAFFIYNQRGHQFLHLVRLDLTNGSVSPVTSEEPKTFVDYANKVYCQHLDSTNEVIWMSERSGWNHLYLVDRKTGKAEPITKGEWVVRGVDKVDVKKREITFRAMGMNPGEDPYHVHYCRVKFDGTGLVRLTEGDGTHTVRYSPNGDYLIDTYSRVDLPPVNELRKTSDGSKVCDLEKADVSSLKRAGWKMPERFVAVGRDELTEIHGVIARPSNFDPSKKYPVIEYIYAGPHGFHTPKAFRPVHNNLQKMAELGFIVVQMDGMGTNWRSKAFHDICWKNLGDSGFPDRIAWIKAAAAKHPEMDLSKGVGIFGGSAGGQSSTRAMFAHPDFYTVAVSDCGCHDNRMDKIWWNELWMSWPVGKHYAEQSNTNPEMVKQFKGKLMLVVGELDRNVDPASTMQVANALVKADKDFDLLIVPGAGHGACESPYGQRRRMDFFVRHLMKVEPRAK